MSVFVYNHYESEFDIEYVEEGWNDNMSRTLRVPKDATLYDYQKFASTTKKAIKKLFPKYEKTFDIKMEIDENSSEIRINLIDSEKILTVVKFLLTKNKRKESHYIYQYEEDLSNDKPEIKEIRDLLFIGLKSINSI